MCACKASWMLVSVFGEGAVVVLGTNANSYLINFGILPHQLISLEMSIFPKSWDITHRGLSSISGLSPSALVLSFVWPFLKSYGARKTRGEEKNMLTRHDQLCSLNTEKIKEEIGKVLINQSPKAILWMRFSTFSIRSGPPCDLKNVSGGGGLPPLTAFHFTTRCKRSL